MLPPPRALVSIEDILARAGMTFAIDQSLTMRQCDPVSTPRDYRENTQHCEISNKHLEVLRGIAEKTARRSSQEERWLWTILCMTDRQTLAFLELLFELKELVTLTQYRNPRNQGL